VAEEAGRFYQHAANAGGVVISHRERLG